jgi:hypothetical protein
MQIQDLTSAYQAKTDEEFLELATESEQLTPEAHSVLISELARRRIDGAAHWRVRERSDPDRVDPPRTRAPLYRPDSRAVAEFIASVVRVYHSHLWVFVKLTGPAVVVGYMAIILARDEGREIAKHLPRGAAMLGHQTELFEIWLLTLAGYLVSWIASSFSFGAICSAVRQIAVEVIPSASSCFADVRQRIGSFLRLSLVLFALVLAAEAVVGLLTTGVFWMERQFHYRLGGLAFQALSFAFLGLALLVVSRFGLATPAVVLDNCTVWQAMFRSDELTEGKWVTLAILLAKSLIGGYVAGMLPFWLTRWAWPNIQLPWWVPAVGSIAAVTLVEPFMFIGFALLYVRMSALSPVRGRS